MNLFAAFNSDGYKLLHGQMYAEGSEVVYSNLTPRSDKIHRRSCTKYYDGRLVLVGLQGAFLEIVESWDKFFKMDLGIAIARFKLLCDNYVGKDVVTVEQLTALHKLGYLPLEVKTLDEGSKVPMGIPVLTVRNTVKHAYWLVNFLETTISDLTWKTSTCATIAAEYKAMLTDFAIRTGTPVESVLFQAHDFSARGMSGPEDAARSGLGHISSFLGTDTLGAVIYAQDYYGAGDFVAATVPATEHAVSTSNILRIEEELANCEYEFKNKEQSDIQLAMEANGEDLRLIAEIMFMYELMLKFPTGILSYVADSFDFYGLISRGLPYMKDVIMRRQSNGITPGRLVIRPDSGDPVEVLCGLRKVPEGATLSDMDSDEYDVIEEGGKLYKFTMTHDSYEGYADGYFLDEEVSVVEQKGAVEVLMDIFGYTETSTGHKLMDGHIGLIYGDSITTTRCLTILQRLFDKNFASGNTVFGIGSFTYQCVTRDTFGFAVKATYTEVNAKAIPIFKDPKTDSNKKSAKGLLFVGKDLKGDYYLKDNVSCDQEESSEFNELTVRFKDGIFMNLTTLDVIRAKL